METFIDKKRKKEGNTRIQKLCSHLYTEVKLTTGNGNVTFTDYLKP